MIGRKIWVVLLTLLMAGSAFCALPCAFGESAEPLYESTFEDQVQGLPAGWSFGEGSYSQEASVSGGRLILDGTASNTKPTSAMLSDITGADLSVELDMTISDASDSGRWAGVILRSGTGGALRVQFKSDASAASGITIAELRADGTISRTVKLASAQAFDPEKLYRVRVAVLGKAVAVYVDGGLVTVAEGLNATIAEGQVGLCAVGCKLQADTVRVEVLASLPDLEDVSGLNSPTYTASAVSVTPVLATPVYSAEQARAAEDGQLLEVRIGANLSVLDRDGRPSCDIGSLLSAIGKRYIPVFTPVDASAASALAGYLNARNVTDAFIRSADAGIVSAVREACPMLSGILDLSGQSVSGEEQLLAARDQANGAGAKVILLSAASATAENVAWLQKRLMTVWSAAEGEEVLLSVLHGVNGVVTSDPEAFAEALGWLGDDNAMVRPPLVVGHRGMPNRTVENSVRGAVAAADEGADAVELDIYLTTDNRLVILHDGSLDRTTTGSGSAETMTLAQIRRYTLTNGDEIPVLDDFFTALRDRDTMFFIEIKTQKAEAVSVLASVINQYGMQARSVIISFEESQLRACREKLPGISLGYLINFSAGSTVEETLEKYLAMVQPINATINPSYGGMTAEFVQAAAMRGLTVWPWTYRSQQVFAEHFAAGYYGLTTDNSDWGAEYGIRLTADSLQIGDDASTARALTGVMRTKKGEELSVTCGYRLLPGESLALTRTADGRYYGTAGDSARAVLTYEFRAAGIAYTLYSEPVTLTVSELEPEPVGPEDPEQPETPDKTGGCGGSAGLQAAMLLLLAAGAALAGRR